MLWSLAADALWILALAVMAGTSREAWKRTPSEARVPLAGLRVSRLVGYWALPAAAFAASLWLLYMHRTAASAGDAAMLMFGVRAVSASLVALLHLRWVGRALAVLAREGALKP